MKPLDQQQARVVVTEFQATKERRDSLRSLPDRTRIEIRLAEMAHKVADARRTAAEAVKANAEAEHAAELAKGAVTPN